MMKKKTQTQKYIDTAVKQALESVSPSMTITDTCFYGVKWDAKAVNAVQTIADGFLENAKGLSKLAEVLKASNVEIDAMIKVDNPAINP